MPTTDPLYDAQTLAAAARSRHPCCQDLETACQGCWFSLLAERVAQDWLERHGPTLADGDMGATERHAAGDGDLGDTAVRRR